MKYYGRFYSTTESLDSIPWWFCPTDGTALTIKNLFEIFGFKDQNEILESGVFIPFFKTDISKLEREFLIDNNLKNILKCIDIDERFDIKFREYIDQHGLSERWHEYEGEYLRADAIAWCKENSIKFVDDPVCTEPVKIKK